jgi:hypothetical protein
MRFIIMHKTDAHWEAGAVPTAELVQRVGGLIGELAKAGAFVAGEGLRPSAEGVRVRFSGGTRKLIGGPFEGDNELPARFTILRVASIDDAVEWAARQAAVLGDGEADIRPVTEPWDIGLQPPPATRTTRRYMVLRKATPATEAGVEPSTAQRAELARLIDETARSNAHVTTETMRPSRRGRRYKGSSGGVSVLDGPFIESKELIGGYMIVSAESLDEAGRWARRYIDVVEAAEVDVRELA